MIVLMLLVVIILLFISNFKMIKKFGYNGFYMFLPTVSTFLLIRLSDLSKGFYWTIVVTRVLPIVGFMFSLLSIANGNIIGGTSMFFISYLIALICVIVDITIRVIIVSKASHNFQFIDETFATTNSNNMNLNDNFQAEKKTLSAGIAGFLGFFSLHSFYFGFSKASFIIPADLDKSKFDKEFKIAIIVGIINIVLPILLELSFFYLVLSLSM